MSYFHKEEFVKAINHAIRVIANFDGGDEFEHSRNHHLRQIFSSMKAHSSAWEETCQYAIENLGERFQNALTEITKDTSSQSVDELFSMAFRFLSELYIFTKNELNAELESARNFAISRMKDFSSNSAFMMESILRHLPLALTKEIFSSMEVKNLKGLSKLHEDAQLKREEWKSELTEQQNKVLALKNSLDSYKTAFNFVGLYDGFDELYKAKLAQKKSLLFWLNINGALIFLPLIVGLLYIREYAPQLESHISIIMLSALPTLSITALLVYFFRVLLHNFNALNSQILQLDLRKTLCRFIQNYADYSAELKSKNGDSLLKFEQIIFSPLTSGEEKLPSTFDGIDQLTSLVKSIKK